METRSSKYLDKNISTKPKLTRTSKNKYLYDEVNNKIGYEEIENFSYDKLELDKDDLVKNREEFHRKSDLEKSVISNDENVVKGNNKVYDINSVLEEAKKNRDMSEKVEKKRKFQNVEYNILSDLNRKYANKKEKIEEELEQEGIRELIDTITSKNLVKELSELQEDDGKDLMSELLPTNTLPVVDDLNIEDEVAKEILLEQNKSENESETRENDEIVNDGGKLVNSFYTRSMDLTEQDFELRDELIEESRTRRRILILVVLIIIVIIAIIGVLILKNFDII